VDIGFALTIILALVPAISIDVEALTLIPREKWFSFAGGVAIAYVVLDILPRLTQAFMTVEPGQLNTPTTFEISAYSLILLGILVFYGLEALVRSSQSSPQSSSKPAPLPLQDPLQDRDEHNQSSRSLPLAITILHITCFVAYTFILSNLLNSFLFQSQLIEQSLFSTVLLLYFIVLDEQLQERHQAAYRKVGRWCLAIAILFGALVPTNPLRDTLAGYLFWAFIAGSLLFNGLKDELSEQNGSCYWSFCFGTVVFSIVLLLL
jgi:hypothetical protein